MEILHSVLSYGCNSIYYQRPLALTPNTTPTPSPPLQFLKDQQSQSHHKPLESSSFNNSFIRFPTPPITPPRYTITNSSDSKKIGQGLPSGNFISNNMSSCHETEMENATSSESSSPSSEHICQWIDCGSYFKNLDALAAHVTQLHAVPLSDGLYYCRWSGCQRSERGFNARYKMLVHVRTHTKEKPHQCHLCEKSFSRAENLKIHLRSHSGEKPYICNYEGCNKAYSNSSDRFKHTRTHILEKPYVCKVQGCQKRYTDPSSLRKHVKTFKHSTQIIDDKINLHLNSTEINAQSDKANNISKQRQNLNRTTSPQHNAEFYANINKTSSETLPAYFYNYSMPTLPLPAYDVCRSLERTHLDYYYPAETLKPNFWSHESFLALGYPNSCGAISSHRPLNALALETPLDLPLDLRTHRK